MHETFTDLREKYNQLHELEEAERKSRTHFSQLTTESIREIFQPYADIVGATDLKITQETNLVQMNWIHSIGPNITISCRLGETEITTKGYVHDERSSVVSGIKTNSSYMETPYYVACNFLYEFANKLVEAYFFEHYPYEITREYRDYGSTEILELAQGYKRISCSIPIFKTTVLHIPLECQTEEEISKYVAENVDLGDLDTSDPGEIDYDRLKESVIINQDKLVEISEEIGWTPETDSPSHEL